MDLILQKTKENLRGIVSSTVYIQSLVGPSQNYSNRKGYAFSAYLKYSKIDYKIDKKLTSDVKKGIQGFSFDEAVGHEMNILKIEQDRRPASFPVVEVVRDLSGLIEIINTKRSINEKLANEVGDCLATLDAALEGNVDWFCNASPTIADFVAYSCFSYIINSKRKGVLCLMNGRRNLVDYCIFMETFFGDFEAN